MQPFKSLSANTTTDPVLFLNPNAPRIDIAENAERRMAAAKDLMHALSCMTITNVDGKSLVAVADATYLLLSDAQDLLHAAVFNGGNLND